MLPLKTDNQVKRIVNSVVKAVKTGNMEHLTKQAYTFLYLASGFIAHYDLHGFRRYYSCNDDLGDDIKRYAHSNRWLNFQKGDRDYEYYRQKAEIYNQIVNAI